MRQGFLKNDISCIHEEINLNRVLLEEKLAVVIGS